MQQSTTTTKVTLFHAAHQEALALDLSILEKLLRSNRAAQRRTKYYQRLDMACRCMRKHNILNLYQDYQQLSSQVTEVVERKRKQKKRQQVFWDLELAGKTDEKNQQETQQVKQEIEAMRKRISANVPETVDRLEYASEALFKEMARGFFLSLCSVAAACIARIRVLLQNLASQILYEWPAWEKGLVEVFGKAIESAIVWEADSMALLRESFHPPISSFLGDSKQEDQVQDLLRELGVDINSKVGDGISQEGDTSENEETTKLQSALDKPDSKSRDEDDIIDFGERLSSHGADKDEEVETAPDYMAAAVSQIQGNLALSKKAKAAKQAKTPPSSSSKSDRKIGSEKKTGSDVKLSRQKDVDKKRDADSSAVKQKKKKRKDSSSKSKSSKKTKKSSGEFFDNLFK